MRAAMTKLSVDLPVQAPAEIAAFLKDDTKGNTEVIKAANIKLE